MVSYQQCRYKDIIEYIPIRKSNGRSYVFLEDIQDHFPDVKYCAFDKKTIPFEHDNNGKRLDPWRIPALEAKIIDCHPPQCTTGKLTDKTDSNQQTRDILLRQNFELQEKSAPCHFIVFPEDATAKYNPVNWLRMKFRLYLLCEYDNGNDKRCHLAFHEGYELKKPCEFFKRYLPYIRKMLKLVKVSLSVGSIAIPQLAHLASGTSSSSASVIKGQTTANQSAIHIEKLDAVLTEIAKTFNIQTDNSNTSEAVGPDFRALQYFLNKVDERNDFGNLYRTMSSDGHIYWKCVQHCDSDASENHRIRLFNSFTGLGGQIQGHKVIIQGQDRKKNSQMFNILQQGLPTSFIVLQDIVVDEKDFEKLLVFISRQSLISRLTIENIIVKDVIRKMEQQAIVLKLREVLKHNVKLTIHYCFTIPLQKFETKLFNSIANTDHNLIFEVRSEEDSNALQLVGTSAKGFSVSIKKYAENKKNNIRYSKAIGNIFSKISNINQMTLCTGDILNQNINEQFAKNLQEFTIDCRLTLEQIQILSNILSSNKTLKVLNIFNICEEKDRLEACKKIFSAIKTNRNLVELSLVCDSLNDDFSSYLREMNNLHILKLLKCLIQQNNIHMWQNFLRNTSIHTLSLELVKENCETHFRQLLDTIDRNPKIKIFELNDSRARAIFRRKPPAPAPAPVPAPVPAPEPEYRLEQIPPVRVRRRKFKKLLSLFSCFGFDQRRRPIPTPTPTQNIVPRPRKTNSSQQIFSEPLYELCHHPNLYKPTRQFLKQFQLKQLHVHFQGNLNRDIERILRALRQNTTVTHLKLNDINISRQNASKIIEVSRNNHTVHILEINDIRIY